MASETIRLRIEGMGCDACVRAVQAALDQVCGVRATRIDLAHGLAEVEIQPPADPGALISALDRAGYDAMVC